MPKPILLHLGDAVKWNRELYKQLEEEFQIVRSYSMDRDTFKAALLSKKFGDFTAIYRPFWNTGGEMGRWDDELISLLPSSCRIYTSAGAGFDWVDTKALAERGILYCNSAAACTESVADSAIYLILNAFRRFSWSSQAARSLDSEQFLDAHRNIAANTHNPNGHTLGIIGLGKIGYRIAQKAYQSFGMRIIYHDLIRIAPDTETSVNAEFISDIHPLLKLSDCVVLATSYSGKKILEKEHFANMKKGGRFVNIARGKLVDEEALVEALESGHLFSAGLDVHFDEPHVDPRLAKMSNVELQCHTAGASVESHIGFERLGIENILCWLKTGQAISPVNLHWLDRSKL